VADGSGSGELIDAIGRLARTRRIDRVVALEEFDVLNAAAVREHFLVSGMGTTAARVFRDKLAMRTRARAANVPVPEFVHLLNEDAIRAFIAATPSPWVMKPRSDVSAIGIQVCGPPSSSGPRSTRLKDMKPLANARRTICSSDSSQGRCITSIR
jgi:biotin carboxylase